MNSGSGIQMLASTRSGTGGGRTRVVATGVGDPGAGTAEPGAAEPVRSMMGSPEAPTDTAPLLLDEGEEAAGSASVMTGSDGRTGSDGVVDLAWR